MRRKVMAVIGDGGSLQDAIGEICVELGRRAIDAGFRLACGGLGGVMDAAARGARASASYREGDIIGLMPTYDRASANPYIDIVVPTGMGIARNVVLMAMADVVVAVGGGSGTLSEIAIAWQLGKPIVGLAVPGWSDRLAGTALDQRRADSIERAATPEEAVTLAKKLVPEGDVHRVG